MRTTRSTSIPRSRGRRRIVLGVALAGSAAVLAGAFVLHAPTTVRGSDTADASRPHKVTGSTAPRSVDTLDVAGRTPSSTTVAPTTTTVALAPTPSTTPPAAPPTTRPVAVNTPVYVPPTTTTVAPAPRGDVPTITIPGVGSGTRTIDEARYTEYTYTSSMPLDQLCEAALSAAVSAGFTASPDYCYLATQGLPVSTQFWGRGYEGVIRTQTGGLTIALEPH